MTKRDSFGSHYSSDSMCTVGSSSGGTNRDDAFHAPHQLHSSASDPTVPGLLVFQNWIEVSYIVFCLLLIFSSFYVFYFFP